MLQRTKAFRFVSFYIHIFPSRPQYLLSGHPYENLPGMVMMMDIAGPSDRRGGSNKGRELTVSEISDQLEESVILDGPMATSEDLQLIAK